jgi:hypothetical protein
MTNLIETRPTGPAVPLPPPRTGGRPPRRTPDAVRVLWKVFAGLLVVGALVWGPYQVVVLLAHEERVELSSYPAAGLARLQVDSASGSIRVEGTDGDSIEVRAEISDGLRRTGESQTVDGETLRLDSTCPNYGSDWCWVNYRIRAPRELELVLDSDNSSIRVAGMTGAVSAHADNGSVELSDLAGPIDVSADNGRVEASRLTSSTVTADTDNGRITLEFAAPPTMVEASADNGSVEVVVPDDGTSYRLDIETDHGGQTEDVPIDSSSPRSIIIRTDNGSATARTGF